MTCYSFSVTPYWWVTFSQISTNLLTGSPIGDSRCEVLQHCWGKKGTSLSLLWCWLFVALRLLKFIYITGAAMCDHRSVVCALRNEVLLRLFLRSVTFSAAKCKKTKKKLEAETCGGFSSPVVSSSGSEVADVAPLHPCDPVEHNTQNQRENTEASSFCNFIPTIYNVTEKCCFHFLPISQL